MANDPHRDLLPVKEISEKSRGGNDRIDHQILAKLPRYELEDKYLRLHDEITELKKQLHLNEEKNKRLGTKLMRLINERKNGSNAGSKKQFDDNRTIEELQIKLVELEHENYYLKDKNVVLKQQLASHARQHAVAHRSPVHTNIITPLISQRQASATNINEVPYALSNQHFTSEHQLRVAESHIEELNNEIKSLTSKLDGLQQEQEKMSLDSKKVKVAENIELIRLQRSLKQQAIQIAALQAQVQNSDAHHGQLKTELAMANQENDSAMQRVTEKQQEVLGLYSKLQENSLNVLEHEELKQRLNDLLSERNSLKEQSEMLLKAMNAKQSESELAAELKQLLEKEKRKNMKLTEELNSVQMELGKSRAAVAAPLEFTMSNVARGGGVKTMVFPAVASQERVVKVTRATISTQTVDPEQRPAMQTELDLLISTQLRKLSSDRILASTEHISLDQNYSSKIISLLTNTEKRGSISNADENGLPLVQKPAPEEGLQGTRSYETVATDSSDVAGGSSEQTTSEREKAVERMQMEREMEYMRQMLRTQTQRCEQQEMEIQRLGQQHRLSEEKYADTAKRLDTQLKILQHFEQRMSREVQSMAAEEPKTAKHLTQQTIESNSELVATASYNTVNIIKNSTPMSSISSSLGRKVSTEDGSSDTDGSSNASKKTSREGQTETDSSEETYTVEPSPVTKPQPQPQFASATETNEGAKKSIRTTEAPAPKAAARQSLHKADVPPLVKPRDRPVVKVSDEVGLRVDIEWLDIDRGSSLWTDEDINFLFVDFKFLDVTGEETETPESVKKPKGTETRCYFNFVTDVEVTAARLQQLKQLADKRDAQLIVFSVVSDPEGLPEDEDCVDLGTAVMTVEELYESKPDQVVELPVLSYTSEHLGILAVKLKTSTQVRAALSET